MCPKYGKVSTVIDVLMVSGVRHANHVRPVLMETAISIVVGTGFTLLTFILCYLKSTAL